MSVSWFSFSLLVSGRIYPHNVSTPHLFNMVHIATHVGSRYVDVMDIRIATIASREMQA